MPRNPFDIKPDRITTIERRGLIALAILVCVTLLAIAAWRTGQYRSVPPAPLSMEQSVPEAPSDSITHPADKKSGNRKKKQKKSMLPKNNQNQSPLDRRL